MPVSDAAAAPRRRRPRRLLTPLWLALLTLCGPPSLAAAADSLRLQLQWVPQAQFAGYYLAQDMGWYAEAGLQLEILPHGPEHPAAATLADGTADIGVFNLAEALQLLDAGHAVVNLQQFKRQSTLVLVSRRSTGIRTPEDLAGRRVARWSGFALQPDALFRRHDVTPEIIDQGASMALLSSGAVDVAMATSYNEMVELYLGGLDADELHTMPLADYGVGLPEDGIYVRAADLQERARAFAAFVAVSRRGWQHAFNDPEAALDAVMQRTRAAGRQTNRAHQALMLAALRDFYLDQQGELHDGALAADEYLRAWELLRIGGLVEASVAPPFASFKQRPR